MGSSNKSFNNHLVIDISSSISTTNEKQLLLVPKDEFEQINHNRVMTGSRPIMEGCEVSIEQFPEVLLKNLLNLKWKAFLSLSGPIHPTLIREFYANYEFSISTNEIKFRLFHKEFSMTLEEFGETMDVPSEGAKFFSRRANLSHLPDQLTEWEIIRTFCPQTADRIAIQSNGLTANDLAPKFDLWYKIISRNIYCKTPDLTDKIHASEASLLWCLHHQLPVNMAYFMAMRMSGLTRDESLPLPFGAHLTKLFKTIGVKDHRPCELTTFPIHYGSVRSFFEENEGENTPAWSATGSDESVQDDQFIALLSPTQRAILHRQNRKTHKLLKKFLNKFVCGKCSSQPSTSRHPYI